MSHNDFSCAPVVPSPPGNFSLSEVAGAPTSLLASWAVPDPENGIISGYIINCSTSSGEVLEPFSASSEVTSSVLNGLTAFTEYTCVISATTGAGEGSASDIQRATTVEDGM